MPVLIRDGVKTELDPDEYTPQEGDTVRLAVGEPNLTLEYGGAEITISANPKNCFSYATVIFDDAQSIFALEGGLEVTTTTSPFSMNTPCMMITLDAGAAAAVVAAPEAQQNTVVAMQSGVTVDGYGKLKVGEGIAKHSLFRDPTNLSNEEVMIAQENAEKPAHTTPPQILALDTENLSGPSI